MRRFSRLFIGIMGWTSVGLYGVASFAYTTSSPLSFAESTSKTSMKINEKNATDADHFRKIRRVGIGTEIAGSYGIMGLQLDLNLTNASSLGIGMGGGPRFQAVSFGFRDYMRGESFQPYVGLAFSRWTNSSGSAPLNKSTPSYLAGQFMTDSERATGDFAKNLLIPSIGIQYYQLSGDWAGVSLFAELDLMADIGDFQFVPNGGFGVMYYF